MILVLFESFHPINLDCLRERDKARKTCIRSIVL